MNESEMVVVKAPFSTSHAPFITGVTVTVVTTDFILVK